MIDALRDAWPKYGSIGLTSQTRHPLLVLVVFEDRYAVV